MKTASLTLLLAWAVQAHADTTLPSTVTGKRGSWADSCAARIDAAAKRVELKPGARASQLPLVHEDGSPDPMQRVDYCDEHGESCVSVGTDSNARPDSDWKVTRQPHTDSFFRRLNHKWAKISVEKYDRYGGRALLEAADECLQMGETK